MKRRALLLLPALLAGCASPEPAYYTLAVRPGTPAGGTGPRVVEVRRIGLAGYLDRPGIVRNDADYRLRITPGEQWGEPLGDMLGRVLAEDLQSRLPGSSVFTSAASISANPDATVELDVQRLDADASGQVVLLAQVAVSRGERRRAAAQTVRLAVPPAGPGTTGYVAAVSTAVGQLADRVAAMLVGKVA